MVTHPGVTVCVNKGVCEGRRQEGRGSFVVVLTYLIFVFETCWEERVHNSNLTLLDGHHFSQGFVSDASVIIKV